MIIEKKNNIAYLYRVVPRFGSRLPWLDFYRIVKMKSKVVFSSERTKIKK